MAEFNRKISAASARSHTRKSKQGSSFRFPSGVLKKLVVILFVGSIAWVYEAIKPPAPLIVGTPDGPPVTAPRIKLRDGRNLAYKEHGVPKDLAKYKIVFVHGSSSCRHDALVPSKGLAEELGVYLVSFDRAGYGESDANLKRTLVSTALDIVDLADQLGLGSKFYVIGMSMGGQIVWTCLKYIPHRLAGAALIAPVINYWWSGFPANLSGEAFEKQLPADQWAVRVAHHAPWLTYWWNTQKLFPSSNVLAGKPDIMSPPDKSLRHKFQARRHYVAQIRQQGEYASVHLDMIIGFGSWDFSPMDLDNPFPNNEGSVHIWHGHEDWLVPVSLQRYIAEKLPWVHYHEIPDAGHFFMSADGQGDAIIKELLLGKE